MQEPPKQRTRKIRAPPTLIAVIEEDDEEHLEEILKAPSPPPTVAEEKLAPKPARARTKRVVKKKPIVEDLTVSDNKEVDIEVEVAPDVTKTTKPARAGRSKRAAAKQVDKPSLPVLEEEPANKRTRRARNVARVCYEEETSGITGASEPAEAAGCTEVVQKPARRARAKKAASQRASAKQSLASFNIKTEEEAKNSVDATELTFIDVVPELESSLHQNVDEELEVVVEPTEQEEEFSESKIIAATTQEQAESSEQLVPASRAPSPVDVAVEMHSKASMAANLVSTIRSFLPGSTKVCTAVNPPLPEPAATKKVPKLRALEAAESARKKEAEKAAQRAKQREAIEKVRAERAAAKADEDRRRAEEETKRQQDLARREAEATQRKKEREEAERKEREEKSRRMEEFKQKKREEALAAAAAVAAAQLSRPPQDSRPVADLAHISGSEMQHNQETENVASNVPNSLLEAKERLQKLQQRAMQVLPGASMNSVPIHSVSNSIVSHQASDQVHEEPQSYEISPYKSDHDSDDEVPRKPVPDWARGKNLMGQLANQLFVDPDEIFQQHQKTCALDDVFAMTERNRLGRPDFSRRTSSGNWMDDRVTWKEELAYKKAMGYV